MLSTIFLLHPMFRRGRVFNGGIDCALYVLQKGPTLCFQRFSFRECPDMPSTCAGVAHMCGPCVVTVYRRDRPYAFNDLGSLRGLGRGTG